MEGVFEYSNIGHITIEGASQITNTKKGKTFSLPSSWRAKNELIDKFDSVDRPEHKFDSDGVEQWYILNFPISDRGYKNNQHHSRGIDCNIKTQ